MNRKDKKGITLIALVITVIVLLILAGISISMLSGDNSILNQAGRARDLTGEKQIEERINLAVSGAITNGLGTLNYENLNSEMAKQFKNYEISPQTDAESWTVTVTENEKEKKYTIKSTGEVQVAAESDIKIELSIAGEKVTTPPNPDSSVFEYKEGTIDTGYVIRDKHNGNEFVWVPVDKNQKITLKVTSKEDITEIKLFDPLGNEVSVGNVSGKTYTNTNLTPTINGEYKAIAKTENEEQSKKLVVRSLYAKDVFNDYWSSNEGINAVKTNLSITENSQLFETIASYTGKIITNEEEFGMAYAGMFSNMFSDTENHTLSVNNNGGFYIARYEAGIATERTYGDNTIEGNTMDAPLSKADVFVYNYVTRGQAKAIAEKMYSGKSYLITGAGWDRTLDWFISTNNKTIRQVNVDSKEWGNYLDSSFTAEGTGSLAKTAVFGNNTKANNIFDMAGNVFEWTSENNFDDYPCSRGGAYDTIGSYSPANLHNIDYGTDYNAIYGFRVALFL